MSQTKSQLVSPVGILTVSGISVSGVVTATSFVGSGSGLTGVGLGTTGSINTSGIITATSFIGNGSGLSGLGGPLEPISFSPANSSTNVALTSNIIVTFNKTIQTGVGTITIRQGSSSGTIIESFNVGTSSSITINGGQLTINPTSNLGTATTHFVVLPAGVIKDVVGLSSNTLIDNYSFTTVNITNPLFSWGGDTYGQLGQNNTTDVSSPIQIPGTTWSSISGGQDFSLATKTDGTLWAWGGNTSGTLGQNNQTQFSSPVQIPGTSWSSIGGSGNHSLATKTDNTLWALGGRNIDGRLGQNNVTYASSPVQIPGTTWNKISAGNVHSLATQAV